VEIRRLAIVAMFSDDLLFDQLALKGGNALSLVYRLGSRVSVDVDLSLEQDFKDLEDATYRIFRALRNRFGEAGFAVFDEKLTRRPTSPKMGTDDRYGGYDVEFKLIEFKKLDGFGFDIERNRRESVVVGPLQQRIFRIQISKYEYCNGKSET